jgi:hypothetical protein
VPFIVLGLLIHVDESILPVQIIKTLVHHYLGGGFSPRPLTPNRVVALNISTDDGLGTGKQSTHQFTCLHASHLAGGTCSSTRFHMMFLDT